MQTVTTLTSVTLTHGSVRLSAAQAARRWPALHCRSKAKHLYDILRPVQFKAGETIGLAHIDKHLRDHLAIVDDAAAAPETVATETVAR